MTVTDTQSAVHYMDCTESNDEEDDEEEDEGKRDSKPVKEEVIKEVEKKEPEEKMDEQSTESCTAPKWEDFFTTEMLTDSQNSQSHSCCSITTTSPSRMTGSQTPELFSDEETPDNDENFSLTLSASLSNHSSQNMDPCFPDTLILAPERGDVRTSTMSQKKESDGLILSPEMEELSGSQASSDFDIPCTPESKVPRPDELLQLYRKLASGEEVAI